MTRHRDLDEIFDCPACGQPVRRPMRQEGLRVPVQSGKTVHVNPERDPNKRCKYDRGPGLSSQPVEPFPGDPL
jgi:hypothetical protein